MNLNKHYWYLEGLPSDPFVLLPGRTSSNNIKIIGYWHLGLCRYRSVSVVYIPLPSLKYPCSVCWISHLYPFWSKSHCWSNLPSLSNLILFQGGSWGPTLTSWQFDMENPSFKFPDTSRKYLSIQNGFLPLPCWSSGGSPDLPILPGPCDDGSSKICWSRLPP